MSRIDTMKDLEAIKNGQTETLKIRDDHGVYETDKKHVMICGGTGCLSSESQELMDTMNDLLEEKGLLDKISVVKTGCFGFCGQGPLVKVYPDNIFYVKVKKEDAERIVNEHFIKGDIVKDHLFKNTETGEAVPKYTGMDFYRKQDRVALKNCGSIKSRENRRIHCFWRLWRIS